VHINIFNVRYIFGYMVVNQLIIIKKVVAFVRLLCNFWRVFNREIFDKKNEDYKNKQPRFVTRAV